MLFLLFQSGEARYALRVDEIAEVVPLLDIRPIPQAPPAVAGIFSYRGRPVPVVDLSQLMLGRPAHRRLSTRIVLVRYSSTRLLGLIAEKATQTLRREADDFVESGVANAAAPYLGPVLCDASGIIQWIDVLKLLPPAVCSVLFDGSADHGAA